MLVRLSLLRMRSRSMTVYMEDAQRFAFAVLSGIAAETMLFPGSDFRVRQLAILETTLLRLLDSKS